MYALCLGRNNAVALSCYALLVAQVPLALAERPEFLLLVKPCATDSSVLLHPMRTLLDSAYDAVGLEYTLDCSFLSGGSIDRGPASAPAVDATGIFGISGV